MMFSKPDRSAHTSISAPPRIHVGAYLTGGLKELYHRISRRETIDNAGDADIHTNSKGQFRPGHDGPVVMAHRYYITEVLSTRGQSAVLVYAEDLFNQNQVVVIKILHTSYFTIGAQEAECLRRLAVADPLHVSHTVKLMNTFLYGGHYCMVFESLCPQPITDVFSGLQLPNCTHLQKVKKLTLQLLVVLGFLRQQNTIHADLKPENILLKHGDDLNSVQVIDFGNSIQHVHKEVSLYYRDFDVQTLLYRAPEVMFGIPFGTEIDMWSLGCILAELYLGRPLFFGKSKTEILTSITSVLGPLPKEIFQRGKFSQELEQFTASVEQEDATSKLMECLSESRDYAFANFLAQLFRYDPDERLSPSEAAQHPFLAQELCVSFLLPLATKKQQTSSILLNTTTYKNSVKISSEVRRQNPSTYDLLVMGTNIKYESSHSETRVAEVQPYKQERDTCHAHYEGQRSRSYTPPDVYRPVPHHQIGSSVPNRRVAFNPSSSQTDHFEIKHRNDSGFYEKMDSFKSEDKYTSSAGRYGMPAFDLTRNLPSRSTTCRSQVRSRSPLRHREKQGKRSMPFNTQTLKVVYQECKRNSEQRNNSRNNLCQGRSSPNEESYTREYSRGERTPSLNSFHLPVKVLTKSGSPLLNQDGMFRNSACSGSTDSFALATGLNTSPDRSKTFHSVPQVDPCEPSTKCSPSRRMANSQSSANCFTSGMSSAWNEHEMIDKSKNNSADDNFESVDFCRPLSDGYCSRKDVLQTVDCDIFETHQDEDSHMKTDCMEEKTASPLCHKNLNVCGKTVSPQRCHKPKISKFSVSPNKNDVYEEGFEIDQTVNKVQDFLIHPNIGTWNSLRSESNKIDVRQNVASPTVDQRTLMQEELPEDDLSPLLRKGSKYVENVDFIISPGSRSHVEWKIPLEVKSRRTKSETMKSKRKKLILEQTEIESMQNRTTLLVSDVEDLSGDEARRLMMETTIQCGEQMENKKTDVCFSSRNMDDSKRGSYDAKSASRDFMERHQAVNVGLCKDGNYIDNKQQRKCETLTQTDINAWKRASEQKVMVDKLQRRLEKKTLKDERWKEVIGAQKGYNVQYFDADERSSDSDEVYRNHGMQQRGCHRIVRRKSSDGEDDNPVAVDVVRSREGSADHDEVAVLPSPSLSEWEKLVQSSSLKADSHLMRSVEKTTAEAFESSSEIHTVDCVDSDNDPTHVNQENNYTTSKHSSEDRGQSPLGMIQDTSTISNKGIDVFGTGEIFVPQKDPVECGSDSEEDDKQTADQNNMEMVEKMSTSSDTAEDMEVDEYVDQNQDVKSFGPRNSPDDNFTYGGHKEENSDGEIESKSDCGNDGEKNAETQAEEVDDSSDDEVNCVHESPRTSDRSCSSDDYIGLPIGTDTKHDVLQSKPELIDRSSDPAISAQTPACISPRSPASSDQHRASEPSPSDHSLEENHDKLSPKSDVNVFDVSCSSAGASADSGTQKSKRRKTRKTPHAKRQLKFAKNVQKKQLHCKYKTSATHPSSDILENPNEHFNNQGHPKVLKTPVRDPFQFISSPAKKAGLGKLNVSFSLSGSARKTKSTLSSMKKKIVSSKRNISAGKGRRKSSLDLTDKAIQHRLAQLSERSSQSDFTRGGRGRQQKRKRKGKTITHKNDAKKSTSAGNPHSDSDSQDSITSKVCIRKRQKMNHFESDSSQQITNENMKVKHTKKESSKKANSDGQSTPRHHKKLTMIEQLMLSAEKITPRNQTSTPRSTKNSGFGVQTAELDESIIFVAEKADSKQTYSSIQGEGRPKMTEKMKSKTPRRKKNIDAAEDEEIVLLIT